MSSIESKLTDFVNNLVEKDKSIYNATLAISSGNGKLNWSGAAGIAQQDKGIGMTIDTPFYIASITKLFTATIIMKFFEEKKIKLYDPIVNNMSEDLVKGIHIYKGVDFTEKITIMHLLGHTSGIADYFLEKPKGGKNFFEFILNNPDKEYTVEQTIALARDKLAPNFEPGKKAKYSDTNYQLLGKIIEKVGKKKLSEIFSEYFFTPLGMKNTWMNKRAKPLKKSDKEPAEFYYNDTIVSNNKPFESSWADGGLISTTSDCLTFLQALMTGKIIDKKKTLPLMHHWKDIGFPLKYGFGTMFIDMPSFMTMFRKVPAVIGHLGSTGTFLFYAEDLDMYLTGAINQANSNSKIVRIVFNLLNLLK